MTKRNPDVIGLGRAIGISRVPDLQLSRSPTLVAQLLEELVNRVKTLEHHGRFLVGIGEDMREGSSASDEIVKQWEYILAQYRQLTMAVTASSSDAIQAQAIQIYEGAADACLLGGNLSFYISCQTRLLRELYSEELHGSLLLSRYAEFVSYSFLYFGVFHVDRCELARLMRGASREVIGNPRVKLALAAANAVQNANGVQFIRIYRMANARQRTLMNPKLSHMREGAMAELVCAYHALEKKFALSLLGFNTEAEFLQLLEAQKPTLAKENDSSSPEFRFRVPSTRIEAVK